MALFPIRMGVVDVQVPVRTSNIMGGMDTITPVACVVTNSNPLHNDLNPPLATTDTYKFVLALAGEDRVNGGYTFAEASEETAAVSITNVQTQCIRLSVANELLPANWDEAAFMVVFVKVNSSSKYQQVKNALIPIDGDDFVTSIMGKPMRSAQRFTLAFLQSTNDTDLKAGSRYPYGFTFETVEPTTGAINETYNIDSITVDINTGPSFTQKTSTAVGLSFQTILNDIKTVVRSAGGLVAKFLDPDGVAITEGATGLANAVAIFKGNQPVRVNYPPDSFGNVEEAVFLSLQVQNNNSLTLAWSKSATTPVDITYEAAIIDALLIGQHTKLSKLKHVN